MSNLEKIGKLNILKEELKELKGRNPAHSSTSAGFADHSMSLELFQKIEKLEEEIAGLEHDIKQEDQ